MILLKFSNLLFDADNTLFDFEKASAFAFDSLCSKLDIPNTAETYALYETINAELWSAFDRSEISKEFLCRERFVRFLHQIGLHRDPELCNQIYSSGLGKGVFPMPYAEEVCQRLSQTHTLYLVTNAVASVQKSRLKNSVFAPLITKALISEDAHAAKPSPAYFQYVLQHIPGSSKENCLVIGDSLTTDIRGANLSGLPCCWYNPKYLSGDFSLKINWEIHDLRELYSLLDV